MHWHLRSATSTFKPSCHIYVLGAALSIRPTAFASRSNFIVCTTAPRAAWAVANGVQIVEHGRLGLASRASGIAHGIAPAAAESAGM